MSDLGILSQLEIGGLVHIWGTAGAGKTLLALGIAADIAHHSHVLWVNTDGKNSFLPLLRRNVGSARENVSISLGHGRALESVKDIPDIIREDTALVVVDTITRTLDMSRREDVMWGRELFEDVLPTLAGITLTTDCCVIVVSEVRELNGESVPVHYASLRKFCEYDILVERPVGKRESGVFQCSGQGARVQIASLSMEESTIIIEQVSTGRENDCSARRALV